MTVILTYIHASLHLILKINFFLSLNMKQNTIIVYYLYLISHNIILGFSVCISLALLYFSKTTDIIWYDLVRDSCILYIFNVNRQQIYIIHNSLDIYNLHK